MQRGLASWLLRTALAAALLHVPGAAQAEDFTNRLAASHDPYLRLHAHNPVDWYPWGDEALARARRENKPIFLSIGFFSCFWCHQMARESFSDPAIAAEMNAWFVNIKVDREQHPDLDRLYGLAASVLAGQSGWPNNLFLTPDLHAFHAATYLPPEDDRFGEEGFATLIRRMHNEWTEHPDEARAAAAAAARLHAIEGAQTGTAAIDPHRWLTDARDRVTASVDLAQGGYGPGLGGRTPDPVLSALLLTSLHDAPDPRAAAALRATLDALALGGIRDQIGGGFHRYSVDRSWSIPHFEKMTADNAQLLAVFADAAALLQRPLYWQVATQTADWLGHVMQAPGGGFYTAEDSEANGVEGGPYLWTRPEITSVLGADEAGRFFDVYTISSDEPPQNGVERGVLRVRLPIEATMARVGASTPAAMFDTLAPARSALLAARNERPALAPDTKLVASVNGLAIAALAHSAAPLGRPAYLDPAYLDWARLAAEQLWATAWDSAAGLLHHDVIDGQAGAPGFLDDYALLGDGFLALADATGDEIWRERAGFLADAMLARFARPDGSFADSPDTSGPIRAADTGDGSQPSGTSAAIGLLLRLDAASAGARYGAAGTLALRHISGAVAAHAELWPAVVIAAARNRAILAAPVPDLPSTADHVHATGSVRDRGGTEEFVVTLRIDAGYHVNANPASSPDLIPTTLLLDGLAPSHIAYPGPEHLSFVFEPEGLNVYQGTPELVATYPAGTTLPGIITGRVEAQACTAQLCLPPASLRLEVRQRSN